MNKDLLIKTFRNTLAAVVYIFIVSQIMWNGNALFGKEDKALMPFVILLLFSLSAAVVGGLLLGQSVFLFIEGKKKESIQAIFYSIGWMALYTVLGILVLILIK